MPKDFRNMRRERRQEQPGPVIPEDVYSTTLPRSEEAELPGSDSSDDGSVVKTSFYPTQSQLDKLDDLAAEYNRRYRRQRKRIDRQDIIRFLIDQCTPDSLNDLVL
jgi:hypothetical protein